MTLLTSFFISVSLSWATKLRKTFAPTGGDSAGAGERKGASGAVRIQQCNCNVISMSILVLGQKFAMQMNANQVPQNVPQKKLENTTKKPSAWPCDTTPPSDSGEDESAESPESAEELSSCDSCTGLGRTVCHPNIKKESSF